MELAVYCVALVVLVLLLCILASSTIVVNTNEVMLIERLGQYTRTLTPGLYFINPFIDHAKHVEWKHIIEDRYGRSTRIESKILSRIPTNEIIYDIPGVEVITRDRLTANVNGVMFYKITDTYKAVYNISDLYQSMEQLCYTVLHECSGTMELAQLLDNKPTIGKAVRAAFENAEENWGVKVTRFEIQSLRPSEEIVKLTEKLSRTQREATAELEKTR